jgi:putative hemolysin
MGSGALMGLMVAFCLGFSFLLSGMEAGVFALSRLRIRNQMKQGRPAARLLMRYLDDPENFLWTILVGNTLANFSVFAILIVHLHGFFAGQPALFVAVLGLAVLLFYVLFDLLPKLLFRTYPNRLCLALVRPFRAVHIALTPAVGVVETLSDALLGLTGGREFKGHLFGNRDELRLVMQESAQHFTSEERAMINRVLDMQRLTVRLLARPMEQVVVADRATPMREVLVLCQEKGYSRLPVCEGEGSTRRVTGILSLRKLLYGPEIDPDRTAAEYVTPALYLDGELRAEVALKRMQKAGQRMAIVLGLDKREIGVVTVQDILQHVFGEVHL